ncbi:MAG: transglutaminase-like domain-containing protein [Chitinivibrionales bacterium]|nr:transglutaminase-like domain-containing protein [Chitinivibrionales bacterium]
MRFSTICFLLLIPFRPSYSASFLSPWQNLIAHDTLLLSCKGQDAGVLYHSIDLDSEQNNIVLRDSTFVSFAPEAGQAVNTIAICEIKKYDGQGRLLFAQQDLYSVSGISRWRAVRQAGGQWDYSVLAGGITTKKNISAHCDNILALAAIEKGIRENAIHAGQTWQDTSLNMLSGACDPATITCIAPPTAGNHGRWVFSSQSDGQSERWEIDRSGKTIIQEVAPLFTGIAKGYSDSTLSSALPLALGDIGGLFKINAPGAKKAGESIRLALDSGAVLDISVGPFYDHLNGAWILKSLKKASSLLGEPLADSLKVKYTSPTVIMQSNDREIVTLSKKIKGMETDNLKIIKLMTEYVYGLLRKQNTVTFSSALETLHAGFGDCGEHAVLLGALLRAAHIPARVIVGAVYVDNEKAYRYHAWVLAYAGKWLFADAAINIFPAEGDRFPLLIDDDGALMIELMRVVGKIKVSYISTLSR